MAEDCGICRMTNILLPAWTLCGHCFCDPCIRAHITRLPKCPICDEVVLTEDLSPTRRRPSQPQRSMTPIAEGADGSVDRTSPAANNSATHTHAPDVNPYGLPPDGPPPYSSTPLRDAAPGFDSGVDLRSRGQPGLEYSTLLRTANLVNNSDVDMRKKYQSLKKSVTLSSLVAVVLFVIIMCLLVMILAMKQNPVCDLSTPHSEALTVNILGEIRLAREQAKSDHRHLQERLSDIFSHQSSLITGGLSKQILEAKENITTDFIKLENKLNEIFRKVVLLQSQTAALKNFSPLCYSHATMTICISLAVIAVCKNYLFDD